MFAGGFTLESAAAVCGATLDELAGLGEQSLLRRDEAPDGSLRFRLLETVREYALEQLVASGQADEVHERHAEHFLELAETADAHIFGADGADWLERLEAEHDNFRAALDWAGAAGRHELELRLGAALQRFWRVRGHLAEGTRRLEAAVERAGDVPPRVLGRAVYSLSALRDKQGDREGGRALLERALELFRAAGDDGEAARTLAELGGIAVLRGDFDRAARALRPDATALPAPPRHASRIVTTSISPRFHNLRGDRVSPAARSQALALAREHGDQDSITIALHNLARVGAAAKGAWTRRRACSRRAWRSRASWAIAS